VPLLYIRLGYNFDKMLTDFQNSLNPRIRKNCATKCCNIAHHTTPLMCLSTTLQNLNLTFIIFSTTVVTKQFLHKLISIMWATAATFLVSFTVRDKGFS